MIIAINDIGIKLYSGGIHDSEGLVWINMLLFVGLVPCFAILATCIKTLKFTDRILPLLFFIALITAHLFAFEKIGLGRSYIPQT
ncbi:hypothetical protein [Mucilaginibacter glaciei]|uniref:Uncharacterized protein n=1 Tax=Mucilaginibacter glaciei TaxID=2772109 RepID=A0A926NQW2_9SPHI|nr:hypothetical protein [Mucilaginibacter glaciei]MBD1393708.1 hypothetical protein [Mucilaginibacter glaciei]